MRWPRLLLVAALVAPALATLPAQAEPVMSVFPNTLWTGTSAQVDVVLQAPVVGDLELALTPRSGLGGPYTAPLVAQGTHGTRFAASVPLSFDPTGAPSSDPRHETPAAPGLYDAAVLEDGSVVEECSACVTLVTQTAPGIAGPAGSSLRALDVQRGSAEVSFTGRSFADGTTVEAVLGKAVDPLVVFGGATDFARGTDTTSRLTRAVEVDVAAVLGWRDLRFTNADGRSSTCFRCLNVTSVAASVEPVGATTGELRPLVLRSSGVLPRGAVPVLTWVGEGAPSSARDLRGKVSGGTYSPLPGTPGDYDVTALFDFRGAAPGPHAYRAGFVLPDGSRHDCEGQCRFTVKQADPPTAGEPSVLGQQPGTTRSATLPGTGFTRGTTVELEGLTTTTTYRSPTSLTVKVFAPADAELGARTITVRNTDGQSGESEHSWTVAGKPVVGGRPTPVPVDGDPDLDPEPDLAPSAPTMRLSAGTITAQQSAQLSGTAEPGAVLDLFAYTRPSTTFRLVKSLNVPADGHWSTRVAPVANTRVYARARNAFGRTSAPSVVLHVRPQVTLAVVRTGPRTYRYSVRTVPRRPGLKVTVAVGTALASGVLDRDGRLTLARTYGAAVSGRTAVARTPQDMTSAAGTSNTVRLR